MWLIKPENYIETKNMVIKFGGSAQGLSWISLFEQVHLHAPSNELNWNREATFFRAKPILVAKNGDCYWKSYPIMKATELLSDLRKMYQLKE